MRFYRGIWSVDRVVSLDRQSNVLKTWHKRFCCTFSYNKYTVENVLHSRNTYVFFRTETIATAIVVNCKLLLIAIKVE